MGAPFHYFNINQSSYRISIYNFSFVKNMIVAEQKIDGNWHIISYFHLSRELRDVIDQYLSLDGFAELSIQEFLNGVLHNSG